MKKIDYLIISIIMFVIAILFIYSYSGISNNNQIYQIIIKNQVVDEDNIYKQNKYLIDTQEGYIIIYKNDKIIKKILDDNLIYNEIIVIDKTIKMKEANCKGKDCTFMIIDDNHKLPIICTNGVIVKLINDKTNSDIVS